MRRSGDKSFVALALGLAGCTSGAGVPADPAPSSTQAGLPPSANPTTTAATGSATASAAAKPPPAPVDPPMVSFPAGAFHQGSAGSTGDEFGWQHDEVVPAFTLDVTEVTVEAYQACIDTGICTYSPRSDKCNLERPREEYKRDPVNCVTYAEAVKYCEWRGAVLPTDGMWEYAAGGRWGWFLPWTEKPSMRYVPPGTTGDLHGATDGICRDRVSLADARLPSRKQYDTETTCPVGSFPRGDSREGLKDFSGNVSEWTTTPYCKLHKQECDPNRRTVKGASYAWGSMMIVHRYSYAETQWQPTIGFRCARVTTPGKKGR